MTPLTGAKLEGQNERWIKKNNDHLDQVFITVSIVRQPSLFVLPLLVAVPLKRRRVQHDWPRLVDISEHEKSSSRLLVVIPPVDTKSSTRCISMGKCIFAWATLFHPVRRSSRGVCRWRSCAKTMKVWYFLAKSRFLTRMFTPFCSIFLLSSRPLGSILFVCSVYDRNCDALWLCETSAHGPLIVLNRTKFGISVASSLLHLFSLATRCSFFSLLSLLLASRLKIFPKHSIYLFWSADAIALCRVTYQLLHMDGVVNLIWWLLCPQCERWFHIGWEVNERWAKQLHSLPQNSTRLRERYIYNERQGGGGAIVTVARSGKPLLMGDTSRIPHQERLTNSQEEGSHKHTHTHTYAVCQTEA